MHKRIPFKKLLSYSPKRFGVKWTNQFSSDTKQDDSYSSIDRTVNIDKPVTESSQNSFDTKEVSQLLNEAATFQDAIDDRWITTPYPKEASVHHKRETRLHINPENTSIVLFPGQGIIKVGMIKKYLQFPTTKELFEIAKEVTAMDLLKLCLNGPQEKLNRTEFNQVATVISSLAALDKLEKEHPKVFENCAVTAGYSVGEITSLIFAGVITFEDGIRLVWTRGKAMQNAADKTRQGMLSIICTRTADVSKACMEAEAWVRDLGVENPVCRVAIFLHTEHKILAGNIEALEYIEKHKEQYGLHTTSRLPVSGAFHTLLMEPAIPAVVRVLSSIEINTPRCKVYSNFKGLPYNNMKFAKKYILKQMISPVKWEQCMQHIYSRPDGTPFPQTYDVGSGGRMKAILKLINYKACYTCTVI